MGYFCSAFFVICSIIVSVFIYLNSIPAITLCELKMCPFCYGDDYCNEFKENITLSYYSFSNFVFNLVSVKNVYFGNHGNDSVVIKKLADNNFFGRFDQDILKFTNADITTNDLEELLNDKTGKFQVCDSDTSRMILESFSHKNRTHIWTLLKVSVEPLLFELFSKEENWPVPKVFGYCGRAVVVENCGRPLNELHSFSWYARAFVAYQLISAAEKFTFDHKEYRLYLLDISPDNIVVDLKNLNVAFVDLEHVVIQRKIYSEFLHHYTHHVDDEDYAFSAEQICNSHVSDHNVYSVCRLLLSQNAPWPMMNNGLLHSSPASLEIADLLKDIKFCVNSANKSSRFYYSKKIRERLKLILREHYKL